MSGTLVVLGVTIALVFAAPRMLTQLTATGRRPLMGVLAWQATSWSVLLGLLMSAGFVLAPSMERWVSFSPWLHSCFEMFGRAPAGHHAIWLQAVAGAFVVLLLVRLSACAIATISTTHRRRGRHRDLVALLGAREPSIGGARVITGDVPLVYCVPGHGGCVVFSSAALQRLNTSQRHAVLAHEHAHLQGRHDLVVASAALLSCAFPRVALFAQAREQTARLVEMRADDVAARRWGANAVASALLSLADVTSPPGVLAANGVATAVRIERLVRPTARLLTRMSGDATLLLGVLILAVSPVVLAVSGHALICLI